MPTASRSAKAPKGPGVVHKEVKAALPLPSWLKCWNNSGLIRIEEFSIFWEHKWPDNIAQHWLHREGTGPAPVPARTEWLRQHLCSSPRVGSRVWDCGQQEQCFGQGLRLRLSGPGHERHQMHSQPLLAARRLIPVNLVTQLEGPDVALLSIRTQTGTFFNYDIMIY